MRKLLLGFMMFLFVAVLADIAMRIFGTEEEPAQKTVPPADAPAPAPSAEKPDAPSRPPAAPARPALQDAARRDFCLEFPDRAISAIEAMRADRSPGELWSETAIPLPLDQFRFVLSYLICRATVEKDPSYCDLFPRVFTDSKPSGPVLREFCQFVYATFNFGRSYYRENADLDRIRVLTVDIQPAMRDHLNSLFDIVKRNRSEDCRDWAKTLVKISSLDSTEIPDDEASHFLIFLETACTALAVPADKLDSAAPKSKENTEEEIVAAYQAFAAFRRDASSYLDKPPHSATFELQLAKLMLRGGSCGEALKARYEMRVAKEPTAINACLQPENSPTHRFHWKAE